MPIPGITASILLGGGGGAGIIFDDTFTETSNTALESHTPDTGTGWTRAFESTAFAAGLHVNGSNDNCEVAGSNASEGTFYTANISGGYSSANYEVLVTATDVRINDDYTYIGARATFSGGGGSNVDGYFVEYTTALVDLYEVSAGVWSLLVTGGLGATDGDALKLVVNGTTIEVWVAGVKEIDTTDSTHTAANEAGMGAGSFRLGNGDESGQIFDDFQVNDLG